MSVAQTNYFEAYGGTAPENYERYFVPAIGKPTATRVLEFAALHTGERVLDVACGTGILARLAAKQVGDEGRIAGLDLNPGMLEVARSVTDESVEIDWHQGSAESMPLPGESFDVVVCELGLQFMADKRGALCEMFRVLAPGGRLIVGVAGPTPKLFDVLGVALSRHISPETGPFVRAVFSLHDDDELTDLVGGAGFHDVSVKSKVCTLKLPPPVEFMWQYVHSTPLINAVAQADDASRSALESDVVAGWQEFVDDGAMTLDVPLVIVMASK
jgi:SAM-dependent methyltransferase